VGGRARAWVPWIGLTLVQLAVFVPLSRYRALDPDEAYYTVAAKLVSEGLAPYSDFWWPQMPAFPYVYGAWLEVVGASWDAARTASVLLATGIGLLIYAYAARRLGSRSAALVALGVYVASHLAFDWFLLAKAYALATLPLLGAVVLVETGREPASPRRWLLAGVLAGLAVDVRLFFAVGVIVLAAHAFTSAGRDRALRAGGGFCLGVLLGVLPAAALLLAQPRRFLFDNLGYHLERAQGGRFGSIDQKLDVVAELANADPQFLVLVMCAAAAVVTAALLSKRVPLVVWIAAALSVVSLIPNPAFVQDFAPVVPFLILAAVELAADVRSLLSRQDARLAAVLGGAALVAAVVYAASAAMNFTRGLDFYGSVSLIGDTGTRDGVARVSDVLDASTAPGERVLALWPGPLLESHATPVRGFENDYAPRGTETAAVSAADAAYYRMGTPDELERLIRSRTVRVVVTSPFGVTAVDKHTSAPPRDWERSIRSSGYRQRAEVGLTRVYVRH
jgi:4-amino-4-deoxy-L-arabinose transferase-like glycosyltransferase